MEYKIEITITWHIDFPVSDELKENLKESAETRVREMMQDGYSSGELYYEDDEISVRGWWDVSITE